MVVSGKSQHLCCTTPKHIIHLHGPLRLVNSYPFHIFSALFTAKKHSQYFSLISAGLFKPENCQKSEKLSFQNLLIDPAWHDASPILYHRRDVFSNHFLNNRIFTAHHPTTGATQICHGKEFLYSYVHAYLMSKSMSTVQYSNLQNETCWYLSYNHSYSLTCIYICNIYIYMYILYTYIYIYIHFV